jgi:2-oxoglutarate ferredoxin oxidoreductase subunit alpha
MSEKIVASKTKDSAIKEQDQIINDFSMVVATVNGSGSQTSNMAIIRSLFRMGIPVSGKNLFPSNIQGLPTWFTIRASSDGYAARRDTTEILVAMNPSTVTEDIQNLTSGGVCFYPDDFEVETERDDITFYPMPIRKLVKDESPPKELRDYISNMAYVGIVAQVLGIENDEIRGALVTHFQGKQTPVKVNMSMINAAWSWAEENLEKVDSYRVERIAQSGEKILIDGNTASALGAIYGGVSFAAWYPITPASSLADSLQEFLPKEDNICHNPIGGRTIRDWNGCRCRLVGGASDDIDLGPWNFSDGRVRWIGVSRGDPCCGLGRSTHGAQHGIANENISGRFTVREIPWAWGCKSYNFDPWGY